ncbi:glycosyltransferase [Novosphingopyxis sp.]|uniref:glycosyltransferase n=1 Tax=Novosphingopyxis sp. TaxID=2709690 RepID=UPI003B5B809B
MRSIDGLLLCDVTQGWSVSGGGIGSYIRRKQAWISQHSDARHLLVVPGEEDRIVENGRFLRAEIRSPSLPHSPNYRFLLRNGAARAVFEQYRPDLIETFDPYNLPWSALKYRRRNPATTVIAGYHTDFPRAHIGEFFRHDFPWFGSGMPRLSARIADAYSGHLYRRFDHVFGLGSDSVKRLRALGVKHVERMPLGADLSQFKPARRNVGFRRSLGVADDAPLLVYAGRLDREKRVAKVWEAFKLLPPELGAHLLILGQGKWRDERIADGTNGVLHMPGYLDNREALGEALASSDIYVSAHPYETFGMSIVEAQAAGLPIVGVDGGAMIDRVPEGTGLLGPVDDAGAMAANIRKIWHGSRAAMGEAGRALVTERFTWDRTFDTLFNRIYPHAFAARDERLAARKSGLLDIVSRGGASRGPSGARPENSGPPVTRDMGGVEAPHMKQ